MSLGEGAGDRSGRPSVPDCVGFLHVGDLGPATSLKQERKGLILTFRKIAEKMESWSSEKLEERDQRWGLLGRLGGR